MKISIARALKEKNRLIGKINEVYNLINRENVKNFRFQRPSDLTDSPDVVAAYAKKMVAASRKIDVNKLYDELHALEDKLIDLKVKISTVNAGAADTLVRLAEAKSFYSKINGIRMCDSTEAFLDERSVSVTDVIKDQVTLMSEADRYKSLINELQDKIDEFNATHFIEITDI